MFIVANNWWAIVLRGALAILFGVLALVMPGMAVFTLVALFGAYALAEGVVNLVAAFRRTDGAPHPPAWALALEGIFSILAGLLAFFLPGLTALVLLYIIAGWAVATGVTEIVAAVRLRRHIRGEWVLALSGVLSIVFGFLLFLFPRIGMLTVALWIGAYAAVFGALLVAVGLRLRRMAGGEVPGFPVAAPGH